MAVSQPSWTPSHGPWPRTRDAATIEVVRDPAPGNGIAAGHTAPSAWQDQCPGSQEEEWLDISLSDCTLQAPTAAPVGQGMGRG